MTDRRSVQAGVEGRGASWGDNAAGMLMASLARDPDRAAVIDRDQSSSYAELGQRALEIAGGLIEEGVKPGDRVAIFSRRDAEACAAFYGVLASGAAPVVINEQLMPRQIQHVVSHSGTWVLLGDRDLLGRIEGSLDNLARALEIGSLAGPVLEAPVPRLGSDLAQIIYTSGSTGLPKGVTLSHANLWAGADAVTTYVRIGPEDRIASLLPFSFDYGLNQLLCSVATGACLVIERSPVPARIVRTLREQDVSVLAGVPPLWFQLLNTDAFRKPLDSLRAMTNSGGRLPTEAVRTLRQSHPDADLFLMYGLTEAFRSTYLPPEKVDSKPGSIGQAIPGAEILVLDEDLNPCGPGEHGQLVHRGPTVAMGYWDDPEATARVYRPNPLRPAGTPDAERVVFSGDLVYRDEEGDLFFVGRTDTLIKTMGYRVSPDEVAEVLYASGQVVEAVVGSEPDEARGARIVAYVVLRDEGSVEGVETFAAQELPRYMRPSRIEARSELPRTASGKHDARAALRDAR